MRNPIPVLLPLIVAACTDPSHNPEMQKNRLEEFAKRAEADVRENILPFWIKNGPDADTGGFVGEIDQSGNVNQDAPRGSLLTSRILWTFSAAYRRWPDPQYKELADRGYQYLVEVLWDQENGGLLWSVEPSGAPLEIQKEIYGQAFGIYAFSEYYRAIGEKESLDYATRLFELFEKHVRDREHGGYFELFDAEWNKIDPLGAKVMGAGLGAKSQNTHLHVMEAFTNLMRVWPDPALKEAQRELLDIMLHKVLDRESGHLGLFFDREWNVVSTGISYGHDIEAAWLMVEAAEVLGDEDLIRSAHEAAVIIAEATLRDGIDKDGAVALDGEPGRVTNPLRDWWPQAEGVIGFLCAWQISGDETYLDAAEKLWGFIEDKFVDRKQGEWHRGITAEGEIVTYDKVAFWKGPYHNGRAGMEVSERITAAIK